jgi:hypothetical protein
MAVFQAHSLSSQLCRILDSRLATVEDIARVADETPAMIERLARSDLKLDRQTELRVRGAISYFFKRHPRLRENPLDSKRGVVEDPSPRTDERQFTINRTNGQWLMTVRLPSGECDEAMLELFWRILDWRDPHRLKVIS